ncbi:MAG: carboxylesterase family protein [Acidobacteria bacterium]|nr:carboxylesterase family protein [Acidobacteriota bacterium]
MSSARTGSLIRTAAVAGALAVLAAAGTASAQVMLSPDTPVTVTGGAIRGTASDRSPDIVAFMGIPFAAPPVGDLRWKPPAPVVPWDGVRDASQSGATCVQNGAQEVTQSEDCLFLNVWAPRETTAPRPVLYWIHGGGYTGGSGTTAIYDGTALAADGAVVVTINYRLNVFGFLAHPALTAESPQGASGNYGVLDMVAGLEWVRDNIATFGGDPDRVTIFGESAGGGAVMSVMVVPQAEGLFHGAIAQSNWIHGWDRPLAEPARGWEAAEAQGLRVAEALGATGDDALAAMRAASAAEVLDASNADTGSPFLGGGNVWAPNVDGWVIPDDPLAMYRTGRQHDVPLITGLNGNEGSLMTQGMDIADAEAFAAHVRDVYPDLAPELLAHYDTSSPEAATAAMDKLIHDLYFAGPVRAHAEAHAGVSSSAWLYHFTHVPPTPWGEAMGSHHAAELVYVFGSLTRQEQGGESPLGLTTVGAYTDTDMRLSETMRGYWVQFAATGDPNRADLPAWPAFTPDTDRHLELSSVVAPGSGVDVAGAALWEAREDRRRD